MGLASLKIVDGILAELGQTVTPEVRRNSIRTLQVAIQTLRRSDRQALFAQLPDAVQPALEGILQTAVVQAGDHPAGGPGALPAVPGAVVFAAEDRQNTGSPD